MLLKLCMKMKANHCTVHVISLTKEAASLPFLHDEHVPLSLLDITVTILSSENQNKGDLGSAFVFLKESKVGEVP